MTAAQLVVVLGRPGTGKTTLATVLAQHLRGPYLREDPSGPLDHPAAHQVARSNLVLGLPVVLDTVSPTHPQRAAWVRLALDCGARLVTLETFLPKAAPRPAAYAEWDDALDGRRTPIDMTDPGAGIHAAISRL